MPPRGACYAIAAWRCSVGKIKTAETSANSTAATPSFARWKESKNFFACPTWIDLLHWIRVALAELAELLTHALLEELWVSVDVPLIVSSLDTIWVVPTQVLFDTGHWEMLVLEEPPLKVTVLFGA